MQTRQTKPSNTGKDKDLLVFGAIFVIAVIGLIAIFVIFQIEIIPSGASENVAVRAGQEIGVVTNENNSIEDINTCLARYSLTNKNVFFIYSDTCTYSNEMKPWVQQLEGKGNSFVWVNTKNSSAMQIVTTCLSGILRYEGTPEFICPANEKSFTGAFSSINELEDFVINCR
jgi:hypothetical protein